jgi:hypothetical protein
MEPSVDKSVVFCAGSTNKDNLGRSQGILAALTFDRRLGIAAQTIVDKYNVQGCTSMKRFRDRDDLVVGCFKHVIFARYVGTGFEMLGIFENVHNGKGIFSYWVFRCYFGFVDQWQFDLFGL